LVSLECVYLKITKNLFVVVNVKAHIEIFLRKRRLAEVINGKIDLFNKELVVVKP